MAILNLDKYIGNVKNRIAYVGIELEGGWTKPPTGLKLVGDSSVFSSASAGKVNLHDMIRTYPNFKHGECPSPPLEPILIPVWMEKFYADVVDKTCGMHVHMSFKHVHYYELVMEQDYFETMIEYLERWGSREGIEKSHNFWHRLSGKNTYCQKKFHPLAQVVANSKSYDHANPEGRYTFFNYCFRYRSTVECRVLPMFEDKDRGIRAVQHVVDLTNAYLVAKRLRREKAGEEVILTPFDTEELDHERL